MNRQQKESLVAIIRDDFTNAQASFLVGCKGLSVAQMQTLRREVRAKGGKFRVAKNRLVKRALNNVDGACALEGYLQNQLGLVFAAEDFVQVAKVLSDFSKDNPAFSLVVGCLESELIDKVKIIQLASLPSRDVLLAQVCGTLNAPITKFASLLNIMILRLLWTIKQVGEKKAN